MWRPRTRSLGCVVLLSALCASCVALQPVSGSASGAVLTVRIAHGARAIRPIAGLIVGVDGEQDAGSRQFAFAASERVSDRHTDFLVRLDLPPGSYRLRRISGVANGGTLLPGLDAVLAEPFAVTNGATLYLGRIELHPAMSESADARRDSFADAPRIEVLDAFQEDVPDLVRAWPVLRTRALARSPLAVKAEGKVEPGALAMRETAVENAPLPNAPLQSAPVGSAPVETQARHSVHETIQRMGRVLHDEAAQDAAKARRLAAAGTVDSPPRRVAEPAQWFDREAIKTIRPVYPEAALLAGQEGYVDLRFIASPSGAVKDVVVAASQPPGVFDDAALRAVKRWRFKPAADRRNAIGQRVTLRVRFAPQLPDGPQLAVDE